MSKLSELRAQQQALEAQIAEARDQAVVEALGTIHAVMEEAGMSVDDLIAHLNPKLAKTNGRGAPKGSTVAPKYRDEAGNTWAGRGRKPVWLENAIAQGKTLADFAIGQTAVQ